MDMSLALWILIHYYYLFCCSNCSNFDHGNSLRLALVSFCYVSSSWDCFADFLSSWYKGFLGSIIFSLPNPRINHFSKEPCEPRSFQINLLCFFHQLMLHLKQLNLNTLSVFSEIYCKCRWSLYLLSLF